MTLYTDAELTYSATARCHCGAGLAYPGNSAAAQALGSWVCSRVLRDGAAAEEHDRFPFAFYELKSERTISANGATTRPADAPPAAERPAPAPPPSVADLARVAFDAYGASTGGKTWDGRDIPPYSVVAEKTPHVARAWEAAVAAVLKASEPRR